MIIATLSFIQSRLDECKVAFQRCRRTYVTPLVLQGGRDMVLLRSGGWVDALPDIPEEAISCRYLADEQQIVYAGGARLVRFPWLSVVDASHDMTDFFTDLRISSSQDIMNEDVMSLYCHQRQRFPQGPIQITTRDGDEIELDDDFQEVFDSDSEGEDASGSTLPEPVVPVEFLFEPAPEPAPRSEPVDLLESVAPLPESPQSIQSLQSEAPYELVEAQSKEYPSFPDINYIK